MIINIALILSLSLLPALIIFLIILKFNRQSKEPLYLMILCLISGQLTTYLSLIIQKYLINDLNLFNHLEIAKLALLASVEEFSKFFLLYVFMSHTKSFDDIYDGFVYSEIIALSFGIVKLILYGLTQNTFIKIGYLTIGRIFTSLPLHLVCGILMGIIQLWKDFL